MAEDSLSPCSPSPVWCERSNQMAKKKKQQKKMSRNQKIMAIIGVFIILSMVAGSVASMATLF
jgi:hypothetical protein